MSDENKPVWAKTIDVKDNIGGLKRQYSLTLSPWDSKNFDGYKEGAKSYSGHTCRFRVVKFGQQPKDNFISIDPADPDLRQAILEMYDAHDKVVAESTGSK